MFKIVNRFAIGMFIGVAVSCSSPPDKLGSLDLKKWRSDRGGCNDVRSNLQKDFKAVQDELKGKFADDVGKLLGRPDIHQLGERNVKYYVYFLEPGPQCEDIKAKSNAAKVVLKFNAVGLLSEITFQERPI
ncbi:hypothetical protein [Dyadobacter sp. CY323]|uniref:hypothetical protein n=1 Tax=Dyadobacter sp. CY323 TaxID=2907302 RepID=UPI001F16B687|nr:hypothetical protein [Dyadobacter sp. CY323]MCE6989218.1 hypothetical protein [Dyadobacter sp. CY323]